MQPQTYSLLFYAVGIATFSWFWVRNIKRDAELRKQLEIAEFKARCAEDCPQLLEVLQQLAAANERIHEMADSVLRGCPVVKFQHPPPVPPSADHWYFRVRIEGKDHLFTEEAVRSARLRAQALINPASEGLNTAKT